MHLNQQLLAVAKGTLALVVGWAIGFGLMWGAPALGWMLGEDMAGRDLSERMLLGGLLMGTALLALLVMSATMAEARRLPGWLSSLLLGVATSPPLSLLGLFFFAYPLWTVD